jgi:NADH-quinone oxidoreductase subunit L
LLLLAICLISVAFGTVRFTSQGLGDALTFPGIAQTLAAILQQGRLSYGAPMFVEIAALLFLAAFARCAQFPFFAWLPNAAESPTPAITLVQAGGSLIAGVYLVVRLGAIVRLAPSVLNFVTVVGILTALLGAFMALGQNSVKKILACSTVSQFGLIFFALGIGAFSAGLFQLMTHAFAKTLLFLGVGAVAYALSGEDDLRKMGGLYNTMPQISRPFLLATLALCAFPPLAGFFSVDGILRHCFQRSQGFDAWLILWILAVLVVFLTALYSFRLFYQIFRGRSRVPTQLEGHIKQPPVSMIAPRWWMVRPSHALGRPKSVR